MGFKYKEITISRFSRHKVYCNFCGKEEVLESVENPKIPIEWYSFYLKDAHDFPRSGFDKSIGQHCCSINCLTKFLNDLYIRWDRLINVNNLSIKAIWELTSKEYIEHKNLKEILFQIEEFFPIQDMKWKEDEKDIAYRKGFFDAISKTIDLLKTYIKENTCQKR